MAAMRIAGNEYSLREAAGAFGDLGTLIPFNRRLHHCRQDRSFWRARGVRSVQDHRRPDVPDSGPDPANEGHRDGGDQQRRRHHAGRRVGLGAVHRGPLAGHGPQWCRQLDREDHEPSRHPWARAGPRPRVPARRNQARSSRARPHGRRRGGNLRVAVVRTCSCDARSPWLRHRGFPRSRSRPAHRARRDVVSFPRP